jgi:uncharacterized protein YegP (UPF0339 family)
MLLKLKSLLGLLPTGWTFYRDRDMMWRWRHVGRNGRIVGASSESFHNFIDAVDNARLNGFELGHKIMLHHPSAEVNTLFYRTR